MLMFRSSAMRMQSLRDIWRTGPFVGACAPADSTEHKRTSQKGVLNRMRADIAGFSTARQLIVIQGCAHDTYGGLPKDPISGAATKVGQHVSPVRAAGGKGAGEKGRGQYSVRRQEFPRPP